MKNDFENKAWLRDFQEFLGNDSAAPFRLGGSIRKKVGYDLNPNPFRVFSKSALLQVLVGFVVLLFCPQFGLSLSQYNSLMHFMMGFGKSFCSFGCGVFFVGSSLLISSWVLTSDEIRILRQYEFLQVSLLSLLTLGAFLCLGGEVLELMTLVWLAGSICGGLTSLEVGWAFRKWFRSRLLYG